LQPRRFVNARTGAGFAPVDREIGTEGAAWRDQATGKTVRMKVLPGDGRRPQI